MAFSDKIINMWNKIQTKSSRSHFQYYDFLILQLFCVYISNILKYLYKKAKHTKNNVFRNKILNCA